jgi:hypothetical protein
VERKQRSRSGSTTSSNNGWWQWLLKVKERGKDIYFLLESIIDLCVSGIKLEDRKKEKLHIHVFVWLLLEMLECLCLKLKEIYIVFFSFRERGLRII